MKKAPILILSTLLLLAAGALTTGVQLENRDAFCASCHTEPESTYYQRSLTDASDLASLHAQVESDVRCIDCHSGEGAFGRVHSLSQGAWDLVLYLSGSYEQPAQTSNPVGDAGCLKCHTPPSAAGGLSTADLINESSHYHYAEYLAEWRARGQNPLGTCAFCHSAHNSSGDPNELFLAQIRVNDGCNDCHYDLSGWDPDL